MQVIVGRRDHENERPGVRTRTLGPDMPQCGLACSRSRKLKPAPCKVVEPTAIYHDDARRFEPNRQFCAPKSRMRQCIGMAGSIPRASP
jgi:hypothetical protein